MSTYTKDIYGLAVRLELTVTC